MKSTFLYTRATQNPSHYGFANATPDDVLKALEGMIGTKNFQTCVFSCVGTAMSVVKELADKKLIIQNSENQTIFPDKAANLTAKYYLKVGTMAKIMSIPDNCDMQDLLMRLCECPNFQVCVAILLDLSKMSFGLFVQDIRIRYGDKSILNQIKKGIRFSFKSLLDKF